MAVKQKLRSRRGATLMAALLFFLVAAVCGSIILAAATATVSRITTQAEDARAYYSLTSAAQLVRDDLLNSRWKVEVKQEKPADAITCTYRISALDKDGDSNDKISKTFVPWMLNSVTTATAADDSSVFSTVNTMTVQSTNPSDVLPVIYAVPAQIDFKTLYDNYINGVNTELKLLMTNDPEGIDTNGNCFFHSSYKEGGKTRQVYWLELTLNSVKVPAGYVDKTDENHVGDIEFQIGWDNASIRKLEKPVG